MVLVMATSAAHIRTHVDAVQVLYRTPMATFVPLVELLKHGIPLNPLTGSRLKLVAEMYDVLPCCLSQVHRVFHLFESILSCPKIDSVVCGIRKENVDQVGSKRPTEELSVEKAVDICLVLLHHRGNLEHSAVELEFVLHAQMEKALTHRLLLHVKVGEFLFELVIQVLPFHSFVPLCTEELHDALVVVAREDE